jgi:hypothetical protein
MCIVAIAMLFTGSVSAVAQEPPVRRERSGERSGFWLRGNFGMGYASFSSDEAKITGAAAVGAISVGKFFSDDFVGFVDIVVSSITGPTFKMGGRTVTADEDITSLVGGIGIGVGYYLVPSSLFLGGSLSIATLSLEADNDKVAETDPGLAGSLILGKDFVISDKWALGVAGHLILGTMTDKGGEPRWTASAGGLSFTFSFAPDRWDRR